MLNLLPVFVSPVGKAMIVVNVSQINNMSHSKLIHILHQLYFIIYLSCNKYLFNSEFIYTSIFIKKRLRLFLVQIVFIYIIFNGV